MWSYLAPERRRRAVGCKGRARWCSGRKSRCVLGCSDREYPPLVQRVYERPVPANLAGELVSPTVLVESHAPSDVYGHRPKDVRGKALALDGNWCLRSNLDELCALNPPEGVEVIRVSCAGRVSPILLMTALWSGADSVLVLGCE